MPGNISFQFIVKDMLIQSLSMMAVSGCTPGLNWLAGPMINSREPAGLVRKRNGVFQVMIPSPNWLLIHCDQSTGVESKVKCTPPVVRFPSHMAVNPTGLLMNHPV